MHEKFLAEDFLDKVYFFYFYSLNINKEMFKYIFWHCFSRCLQSDILLLVSFD